MSIREGLENRRKAYRNPVYLLYVIAGVALFLLSALVASRGTSPLEVYSFRFFNSIGEPARYPFIIISLFGTLGSIFIVSVILAIKRLYGEAAKVLIGATSAYIIAYSLKLLSFRARPYAFLDDVYIRENAMATYGFPSGHAAVVTVLAMTAYQFLPKRWHKPVTIMAVLVMISRLYLGVHLPADLVGGFSIGLICGGLVNFVLGSRKFSPVPPSVVKKNLAKLGLKVKSVKLAAVDARGSIPYYVKLSSGEDVFVKIVGKENNIADWLFKSWRKIVYRRLEDEAPFMGAKRQLEHEAYVSNLALLAGVKTPRVLGIFEASAGRWGHAQTGISGKSLDRVDKSKLTDAVLKQIWQEVETMHSAGVVHRDLRCANVFLGSDSKPWIIDFGFSEGSMPEEAKCRDRAELIASITTLVGAERSVNIAIKTIGKEKMLTAAPYLTTGVLSSATAKTIKNSDTNLSQIRELIAKKCGTKAVKAVEVKRFSLRRLLIFAAIGIGFYVLIPQIGAFRTSLSSLEHARLWLVGFAVLFSAVTYVFAAISYRALFFIPIHFGRVLIIQVASSFASKLAPAGTGGIALNAKLLTKSGHTITQATSIAVINNAMGFVAQVSLLLFALLLGASNLRDAFSIDLPVSGLVILAVIVGILVMTGGVLVAFRKLRRKVVRLAGQLIEDLAEYKNQPTKLVVCYIASLSLALAFTAALYASAHALGSTLSPLQCLVVFTVGAVAASVTPTPGGIGGVEAGLVAALTATGMDASHAFSITLLYRLVTYWLPIIPGYIGFHYAVNKDYV